MSAALTNCLKPRRVWAAIALGLVVLPSLAGAQPKSDDRGRLLYETYCISCHTTQVHWRDSGLAKDWITLKGQIDRWQKTIGQRWTFDQIDDVARYLNSSFYKFKPEGATRAEASPHAPVAQGPQTQQGPAALSALR